MFALLLFFALAVFDAWITAKRIPQLGIEAEYNPLIRWLSQKFGIELGIWVGVMGPTFFIMILGVEFPAILVYLAGCRTTLFAFQMKVLLGKDDLRTKTNFK